MNATLQTVGDWNQRIQVPLENALAAVVDTTGRSGKQACGRAMVMMAQTARNLTPQSRALRPIIPNPNHGWKTDRRKAPLGVIKWSQKNPPKFVPIFKTGEFGAKIRFFDTKSASFFVRGDRKNEWIKVQSGPDIANPEIIVPGIKSDRRRIIGRRKLAKRSWFFGLHGLIQEERGEVIPGVGELREITTETAVGYVSTNKLSYIQKIMPAGWESTVQESAINRIMAQVAKEVERVFRVDVPRLAASRAKRTAKTLPQAWRAAK